MVRNHLRLGRSFEFQTSFCAFSFHTRDVTVQMMWIVGSTLMGQCCSRDASTSRPYK